MQYNECLGRSIYSIFSKKQADSNGFVDNMAKWNKQLDHIIRTILFLLISFLSACSIPLFGGYGSEGRTREEFAKYVEDVFRLQNHVTSQIMILMESGEIELQQSLVKAEQQMQEICSPINEYASRDIDGLNIAVSLLRRVEKSAEACDKAAQNVEAMLNDL
ncbi:MAG: hypothetical protein HOP23_02280 [Methylococcaceae bacterium]|nr:hypothetical protein [Methylococcaceae bacterium]